MEGYSKSSVTGKKQYINIGSVDLVNSYTFPELYKQLMKEHPELKLYIRTHHSEEIYSLLSNHLIDIGYVFSRSNYPNVISRPIYRELMYLVCNKKSSYHDDMNPVELDQTNEIYLNWGNDFEIWHNLYWPNKNYAIRVNTGSMVENYLLESPSNWSIVPMSLVSVLKRNKNIVSFTLNNPPPPRICYQLTNRYPKPSLENALKTCLELTDAYIDKSKTICAFEPWME